MYHQERQRIDNIIAIDLWHSVFGNFGICAIILPIGGRCPLRHGAARVCGVHHAGANKTHVARG